MYLQARCYALLAILTSLAVPAHAQDRLAREFDSGTGLLPSVLTLAQDSTGFLWAGTRAGLFRYDGSRFEQWAPDVLERGIGTITVAPDGRVAVVDVGGAIHEVTADGVIPVDGRAQLSPDYPYTAAYDDGSRLWSIAADGRLSWRDVEGEWQMVPAEAFGDTVVRRVYSGGARGGVLVAGAASLWHIVAGGDPVLLLDGTRVVDVHVASDSSVIALGINKDLIRIAPGGAPELIASHLRMPPARAIGIEERHGTYWIGADRYLIAVAPDGSVDALGPEQDVAAGGPVLVDREGSLWHAGFATLVQYPEPETRLWHEGHGLISAQTRYLGRSGDVLWVSTWQGTGYVRQENGRWEAGRASGWGTPGPPCRTSDDGLLFSTGRGLVLVHGRTERILGARAPDFTSCAAASTGGQWVGTGSGLHYLAPDAHVPAPVATPGSSGSTGPSESTSPSGSSGSTGPSGPSGSTGPSGPSGPSGSSAPTGSAAIARPRGASPAAGPDTNARARPRVEAVLEDRAGRVWVGSGERICHAPGEAVLSGADVTWSCAPLPPGTVHINQLAEPQDGVIWAASYSTGVLRLVGDRWERLAANATLPAASIFGIVPSPRGGVWLVGTGTVVRVAARDGGAGWTVLEQLGTWHGLPTVGGGDLLEEKDGSVWIATALGVIQVPASVRSAEPPAPAMAVVEARVDGRRVPLGEPLVLPASQNRLELRFAALSFRDPTHVRYQVRLSPGEPWVDTDGQPAFHWVDLSAGRHRPQVRASLDGETWSATPAELSFQVLPPWHRTPTALLLFLAAGAGVLYTIYRARVAYLLGLERQRTRIAMDLHDEMGSGLASIGILAGVLSDDRHADDGRTADACEPTAEQRVAAANRRIADEVAATAEELGAALSDIVWSLDPHSATLEELAARLAEHGGRLFADDVNFDTHFPESWPAAPLPLPVLRSVLLIGLEALHNAARHAHANHVTLTIRPHDGGWLLIVSDDGIGLPVSETSQRPGSARGRGLRAMRKRAHEIGGDIVWLPRNGGGTRVIIWFETARRRRGLFRRRTATANRAVAGAAAVAASAVHAGPGAPARSAASHDHAGAHDDRIVHR